VDEVRQGVKAEDNPSHGLRLTPTHWVPRGTVAVVARQRHTVVEPQRKEFGYGGVGNIAETASPLYSFIYTSKNLLYKRDEIAGRGVVS
jgi:hypothetical protein